ncbi:ABC-F family ATP-binding cassette domain-containing protein [Acidaminobacter sp. JC074]|uniref:ribosomal protection-like ABC-F family protein n=1 Tax=Acidaminobacter sp. JC074 TaxID=2530199 RepID=UPI001F0D8EC6|nr:ABC-F family ATP-binding cassette domain-containing protein [Acidaminobacter sp. JC074]MCH4888135.1 ABC-F family ATP-binding cassette domain-containing protein [Acidaminobacter sp. JC074]
MLELSLNQIMKHMGTNLILKDVNFHVYEGDVVGLIGENGSGKSTILKLIAGIEKLKLFPGSWSPGYDYGWISLPRHIRVAYLDQMPEYEGDHTVKEVIEMAFSDVYKIEKEMRDLEVKMSGTEDLDAVLSRYSKISSEYESLDGYNIEAKISKVVTGMKFTESFLEQKFSSLSGGEKTSVELAKTLALKPEILLLDEPTNHLDVEVIEWLEDYIKSYKGIVMIVSHDRYFLDQVTNKTLEIEFLTTKMYKGNYSAYKYQKDELLRIQDADYHEQQKLIKSMKKQIQELRQWAMKSDNNKFFQRAASIQIKLDKMKIIKKPVFEKRNMRLDLSFEDRSGKEAIIIENLSKSYDKKILDNISHLIGYGDHVALVGGNGSGKSTLIKLLMGLTSPDSGTIRLGANVKAGYLPQHISFHNEDLSVLDLFRETFVIHEGPAREYLSKYMFYGKDVFTEVKGLSGGERIRLKLAMLLYNKVNMLILDEPTNHLDIETIETLEKALENFEGTLLFVSHDRYFINRLAKKCLALKDGRLLSFDDYKAYRKSLVRKAEIKPVVKKVVKKTSLKEKDYEKELTELEEAYSQLEDKMVKEKDYLELMKLEEDKTLLSKKIDLLYQEWR